MYRLGGRLPAVIYRHDWHSHPYTCAPWNPAPRYSGPTFQDAKPQVWPRVHPPHFLHKKGGELRVKPGVWRPEMRAQGSIPVDGS
jgi:hypothetical protein